MKKTLFLASLTLGLALGTKAQTVPVIANGTLETWSTVNPPLPLYPTLERPNNWYGSDQVLNHMIGPLLSAPAPMGMGLDFDFNKQIFKSTDAFEGTHAAMLMTKDFGDTVKKVPVLMTNAKQSLNMAAALSMDFANMDITSLFKFSEGTAIYGKRIDSVTAYVKTPATNLDDAGAFVMALKTISPDSNAVVGTGTIAIQPNTDGYVKVNIPVTYALSAETDTMIVGFSSSGAPTPQGYTLDNTLFVDKVEVFVSEPTGVKGVKNIDLGFEAYPNPAKSTINFFNAKQNSSATVLITNVVGQVMHQQKLNGMISSIDVANYPQGTYFYEIHTGDARQIGKFIK